MDLAEYVSNYDVNKSQLAKMLHISDSALYNYIRKSRVPSLEIAIRIHQASEGRVSYLEMLKGDYTPPLSKWDVRIKYDRDRDIKRNIFMDKDDPHSWGGGDEGSPLYQNEDDEDLF